MPTPFIDKTQEPSKEEANTVTTAHPDVEKIQKQLEDIKLGPQWGSPPLPEAPSKP